MRGQIHDAVFHDASRASGTIRGNDEMFSFRYRKHLPDRSGTASAAGATDWLDPHGIQDIGNHRPVIVLADQGGDVDCLSTKDGCQNCIVPNAEQ